MTNENNNNNKQFRYNNVILMVNEMHVKATIQSKKTMDKDQIMVMILCDN